MVLIGDTDNDLVEGKKRGFQVVGIDRVIHNVNHFRAAGGIAIADEFNAQLALIEPDGVIYDGVAGLGMDSIMFTWLASIRTRVIVWNGLRGRDPWITSARYEIAARQILKIFRNGVCSGEQRAGKHRGMLVYAEAMGEFVKSETDLTEYHELFMARFGAQNTLQQKIDLNRPPREIRQLQNDIDDLTAELQQIDNIREDLEAKYMIRTSPTFGTYRSKDGGQYFDSAAWTNYWSQEIALRGKLNVPLAATSSRSARKAAAAKALLTRRT